MGKSLSLFINAITPANPTLQAVSILVVAVKRPISTPKALLLLLVALLVCSLASLVLSISPSKALEALKISETCIAAAAIITILAMPMRDPNMPTTAISTPYSSPTSDLLSPEDDLTLWQFLSVSWMSPLIARGSKAQLDDADVWQLPYDFQHTRLHILFRELKGSVVKRLLIANGLDLIITTTLGVLESAASMLLSTFTLVVPLLIPYSRPRCSRASSKTPSVHPGRKL